MLSKLPVSPSLPYEGLKSALAFYTKKLGLELIAGSPDDGYLEFAAGKGTTLGVFESNSEKSNDTAATFQVDDLTKVMADLRKKKVVFEDYDLPGIKTVRGVATMDCHTAAWFKDPGGNVLCLHQLTPTRGSRNSRGSRKTAVKAGVR